MKTPSPADKAKKDNDKIQRVTHRAKHKFQWSRGVATCACGGWTLWQFTLESARRSWSLHYWNSYEAAMQRAAKQEDR